VPSLVPFVESCIKLPFAVLLTAKGTRNGYDHGAFVVLRCSINCDCDFLLSFFFQGCEF
jgi:hypothetical protein